MAVILIAIGMLLTGIDIHGRFGIWYPAFHVGGAVGKYELSESIRLYTTKNILGNEVQVDLLPDVLGCLFILAGVCMLVKYNRQFLLSIPFIVATAVLSVLLRVSGFITQGPDLVVWILACYFLQIACELFMEYFVIYCTAGATDALVNQATNTRMLFGWWITVLCRVYMSFLTFVGHFGVKRWYQVVLGLATLFFLYHLFTTRKYVGLSKPLKIGERRLRSRKEKL